MDKRTTLLLLLILALGLFLRFYNLGGESFWLDEGTTSMAIKKYSALQILDNVKKYGQILPDYYSFGKYSYDEDLPMYYIILSYWIKLFGMNEFTFRAFSALFSSLALLAVFYLTKYLFDKKVALLATFLCSINLTLIWYAQEARQYSYLLFLSLLSVIFLLKSLKHGKAKHVAALVITNFFIIFSHFPWLIFIIFEGIYALYIICNEYINKKSVNKKIIIAFAIMGILYLTIIGRAISSKTDTVGLYKRPNLEQIARFGIQLSSWLYPAESMSEKMHTKSFDFTLFEWLLLISVLSSAVLITMMFFVGIAKSFYKRKSATLAFLMFFFPIIFALALSLILPKVTVFQLKQMIYIIPIFLTIASVGVLRTKFTHIFVAAIIALSILPIYAYYANPDKQQMRHAAEFLPRNEPIALNIDTAQVVFRYYYGEKPNAKGVEDVEQLKEFVKGHSSFWIILTFTKYSDPEDTIRNYLDSNYKLIEKKRLFDMDILHYKRKN